MAFVAMATKLKPASEFVQDAWTDASGRCWCFPADLLVHPAAVGYVSPAGRRELLLVTSVTCSL